MVPIDPRALLRFILLVAGALALFRGNVEVGIILIAFGVVLGIMNRASPNIGGTERGDLVEKKPIELTDEQLTEVIKALDAGNKVEAVKLVHQYSGAGLKASKDYVDAVAGE
ncbi:MAG: hypothetical protein JSV66_11340 [Trueperaceae bacterium]|nr:MAG: hypothetical protein JSV66_11340 [Trueperaceae bacterium]